MYNEAKNSKIDNMQSIKSQLVLLFEGLANRQFKYNNLPKEIEEWKLEQILFYYGQVVFFKVFDNYVALPCTIASDLDIYGEPQRVNAVAINGQSFPIIPIKNIYSLQNGKLIESQSGVRIKNNEQSISTIAFIMPFVDRLVFIWQSLGINESLSRVKYLIRSNKDSANIIQATIKNLLGNKSPVAVVSDKRVVLEELEKVDLNVEYTPDKFWYDFDKTFNTILTMLGINNNSESDKKERLIVDEVNVNNEMINLFTELRLYYRQHAIEQINTLFNLNMSIEMRHDHTDKMLQQDDNTDEEVSQPTDVVK
jgi:hypothetical protein